MRNTKKAFTLVELIVVITILAILGTIAFISFGGQTAGARNTKVTSDIRNIASAIEVGTSGANPRTLSQIIAPDAARLTNNWVPTTLTFWEDPIEALADAVVYQVGSVNFAQIGQNGDDFKDPNAGSTDVDYLFSVVVSPTFKAYQIAGQIVENDIKKARVNGTFFQADWWATAEWLLSATNSGWASTTPLNDWDSIGWLATDNLY